MTMANHNPSCTARYARTRNGTRGVRITGKLIDNAAAGDDVDVQVKRKNGEVNRHRVNIFRMGNNRYDEGKVRLERIPDVKRETLHGFIERAVHDDAEAIYTDELKSYLGIEDHNTRHEAVNHSMEQRVIGDVHTCSIEGVWALFKRSIAGAFRKMSRKHMDRYLEELEWRFNNRDNPHIFRDTMAKIVRTDLMTYRQLIDEAA